MMHYQKGENIEEEIKKEDLPFKEILPAGQDFLWMRVKGGTKVNNVVSFAKNALDKGEYRAIVWTGVGGGVVKTVSCAEIIKRTHPLYQLTRMDSTVVEEHWIPKMKGLDAIVVKRQIPCLHILMTLDEIDDGVNGVQKPNVTSDYVRRAHASGSNNSRGRGNRGEYRRKQTRNQAQKESRNLRSEENPQTSMQQIQQETQEDQSKNQQKISNPTENSGAKRKRNNKKTKPRDNMNTSQRSSQQQKQQPETPAEQEPMQT